MTHIVSAPAGLLRPSMATESAWPSARPRRTPLLPTALLTLLVFLGSGGAVFSASYQLTDGTITDPIMDTFAVRRGE